MLENSYGSRNNKCSYNSFPQCKSANSAPNFGQNPRLRLRDIERIQRFGLACKTEADRQMASFGINGGYFNQPSCSIKGKIVELFYNSIGSCVYPLFRGYIVRTDTEMMLFNHEGGKRLKIYARFVKPRKVLQRFIINNGKVVDSSETPCGDLSFDTFTYFLKGNNKHR